MLETYTAKHQEHEGHSEFKYLIPNENDTDIAIWAASEITLSGSMLPKSTEEVLSLFKEGRSVIIVNGDNQPVAHAAITFIYDNSSVIEIGGVIVKAEERRKGLGTAAVMGAIALGRDKYPGWFQMALCNAASLPLFKKLGGKELDAQEAYALVPAEAWEACSTCPSFQLAKSQGKICCDTPVSLEEIDPYNQG